MCLTRWQIHSIINSPGICLGCVLFNISIDWLVGKPKETPIGGAELNTILLLDLEYSEDIIWLAPFGELLQLMADPVRNRFIHFKTRMDHYDNLI